jgi:hypothetical protein
MLRSSKTILILLLLLLTSSLQASIVVYQPEDFDMPSRRAFLVTTDMIRPFEYQKIKAWEYATDPLVMYVALWGLAGLTLSVSERAPGAWYSGNNIDQYNGWAPLGLGAYDSAGGSNPIYLYDSGLNITGRVSPAGEFLERMKMEPFATGIRFDPVVKTTPQGYTIPRGTFWAKNFIEPAYFTVLALYMRSKNYHPALLVLEMFAMSALLEFTIRPFFMRASFEQFMKNPLVAVIFGVFMDELSTFLLTTPFKGLHVLAYVLNPFKLLPTNRVSGLLFFDPYQRTASIETIIRLEK